MSPDCRNTAPLYTSCLSLALWPYRPYHHHNHCHMAPRTWGSLCSFVNVVCAGGHFMAKFENQTKAVLSDVLPHVLHLVPCPILILAASPSQSLPCDPYVLCWTHAHQAHYAVLSSSCTREFILAPNSKVKWKYFLGASWHVHSTVCHCSIVLHTLGCGNVRPSSYTGLNFFLLWKQCFRFSEYFKVHW